jgi:Transposase DNA-binding/Transposase DDE domain
MTRPAIRDATAEFSNAQLGDARLDKRLQAIVARAVISPGASFPKMVPTVAEREALYRFVENDRVDWQTVIEPHYESTAERCRAAPSVRIAHDTSWMMFEGDRSELGPVLRSKKRGFAGHVSLAVSADDRRAPFGVVAISTFVRPDSPLANTKELRAAKHRVSRLKAPEDKESVRWMHNVRAAEQRVGPTICIHVMDQEADNFAIFADLVDAHCRFVVRGSGERCLKARGGTHVDDVLEGVTARVFRTVPLNARKKQRGGNPVRSERTATLMIRGATVAIEKPFCARHATKRIGLNVVNVFEPSPPDGAEPIEWTLYTTEPIATIAELTAVVDHYRARWRIEEYFKALKTGCAFEKRQLTTYAALLRALALLAPIAWHLFALCTTARDAEDAPASVLVDEVQLEVLRTLSPTSQLPARPTARDVMRSIADIGGHIRQNGEPGWIVLGRGFEDFVKAEMIWRAAIARGREK